MVTTRDHRAEHGGEQDNKQFGFHKFPMVDAVDPVKSQSGMEVQDRTVTLVRARWRIFTATGKGLANRTAMLYVAGGPSGLPFERPGNFGDGTWLRSFILESFFIIEFPVIVRRVTGWLFTRLDRSKPGRVPWPQAEWN